MSLKAFHIVFIVVSSLLAFSLGAWGVKTGLSPTVAILGFGSGAALVCYGIWFWRKLKHEGLQ